MTRRRDFVKAALVGFAARKLASAGSKPLRGIFPILQTPYTASNQLDTGTLANEVRFLEQCGAQGVVWPQQASEWTELSPEERFAGARAILEGVKNTRCSVVLGVHGPDAETARRYARQAEQLGADAIIALPPRENGDLDRVADYYRAIAKECGLPLFVETAGDMSIDFVLRLRKDIPTLRYVKDEAGPALSRISEYRRVAPDLGVFTGGHGRTVLDELSRGASGSMPAAPFADLYVELWNDWHAGRHESAMEELARVSRLENQLNTFGMPSIKYILYLRGVFPDRRCRSRSVDPHFDTEARRSTREAWEFAHKRVVRG